MATSPIATTTATAAALADEPILSLSDAAMFGTLEQVQLALQSGESINQLGLAGGTAVLTAALCNDEDPRVVRFLIEQGARLDVEDDRRERLTHAFARGDDVDLLLLALEHSPVDAQNCDGYTALMLAARERKTPMIQVLLAHGASVDVRTPDGQTALHFARDGAAVDLLLDAGAKVDQRDTPGHTPLTRLARDGHADACAALIARGAALDYQTPHGHTALVHAAGEGHHDAFVVLLHAGADCALRRHDGVGLEYLLVKKVPELRPAYDAWRARKAMQTALGAAPSVPTRTS